ncbi:hypothetical protein C8J45_103355 [Sphingomonas sp. PP-CE-3G-477]|uniref:hypothetical protein n=1 Tax=Sphingomonas sp. PP-CE-3G-477 TaxID=2135660 RepID=UPI000D350796|nr:hypothetical protein [Sphingomonas sp. PP-CE-3G-477]PTQ64505.1 hypothetical protein C8J45_103355 [Sphingomonas sp. PP-CE-3G-477]
MFEEPTEASLKAMLDEQVERLWADNRERMERLIQYADRCKADQDADGEQRYMTEYAELRQWCSRMSQAIYRPLVELAALRPTPIIMPNPSAEWAYPAL